MHDTPALRYAVEPDLSVDAFIGILRRSTLAERRPVAEPTTIRDMLANASILVTARSGTQLVGVARSITDFAYCTYLSDLAVEVAFQRQGIGKELIARTHEAAGRGTTLILLSAPKAASYYPHIGLTQHNSCWTQPRRVP
ncbi:MAG: GNAT family N-acetyltransferase [Nannocystaceae bacterium]